MKFSLLTAAMILAAGASRAAASPSPAGERMPEFWVEPADIGSLDLFYGRGGKSSVPPDEVYRFLASDKKGHSPGYEVRGGDGRKWKIKIGDEAQSEVLVSRILWALGYHQPVTHFVSKWRMTGGPKFPPDAGRFRLESDHKKEGTWSWERNPFVGSPPYRGLVIANVMLNNWDLTTSNNRIYRLEDSSEHPSRWFVVQDVGGSLGKAGWPVGTRNNIEDFEKQGFVKGVEKGRVEFDHFPRHRELVKDITPADVVWTCRLLARLTDRQIHDAFRAANYPEEVAPRYIRKLKEKIQQGLALESQAAAAR